LCENLLGNGVDSKASVRKVWTSKAQQAGKSLASQEIFQVGAGRLQMTSAADDINLQAGDAAR
jgi:hypothetical protein